MLPFAGRGAGAMISRALRFGLRFALLAACARQESSARAPVVEPSAELRHAPSPQRVLRHANAQWLVFDLDLTEVKLELFGQRAGEPATLSALESFLAQRGRTLVMAT